jgi:hypothetical protein
MMLLQVGIKKCKHEWLIWRYLKGSGNKIGLHTPRNITESYALISEDDRDFNRMCKYRTALLLNEVKVKVFLCLTNNIAYGGVNVSIHICLTSALDGGEWSASNPGRFILAERAPGTHWIGGWLGPRTGVDNVGKRKFLALPRMQTPKQSKLKNVKASSLRLIEHHAMNTCGGTPPSLSSESDCGEWWTPLLTLQEAGRAPQPFWTLCRRGN